MGGFCLLENTFLWAFVCFFSLGFSPSFVLVFPLDECVISNRKCTDGRNISWR